MFNLNLIISVLFGSEATTNILANVDCFFDPEWNTSFIIKRQILGIDRGIFKKKIDLTDEYWRHLQYTIHSVCSTCPRSKYLRREMSPNQTAKIA